MCLAIVVTISWVCVEVQVVFVPSTWHVQAQEVYLQEFIHALVLMPSHVCFGYEWVELYGEEFCM